MKVDRTSTSTAAARVSHPTLRQGAKGAAVSEMQTLLKRAGFSPGAVDGDFGPHTLAAVKSFQRARGLLVDGIVGPKTWGALGSPAKNQPAPVKPVDGYDPPKGKTYVARGTGYYPDPSPMEGGYNDRKGHKLCTLQDYLKGRAPYVSVAMDVNAFPYGTHLRIAELEKKYGRRIDFRVVDTGGAFKGKGTSRIDICTGSAHDSCDATINGTLHLTIA